MDLVLLVAGHQRHRRILGQETDDVHIVGHGRHVLGQGQGIVRAVRLGRLGAVDHEDVLVLGLDIERLGGARLEGVDEVPGHAQEARVVQAAVLHRLGEVFVLGEGAERGQVGALAVVVPGDHLDEVRLQLQQRVPPVEPEPAVLRVQPVEFRVEPLEEPGREAGHPGLVVAGRLGVLSLVREGGVDEVFLVRVGGRVHPGEDARADVGGGDVRGRARDGAGHEHDGGADLVENVVLPVEGGWAGGEGAQEDFAVHPELCGVVGVGVGKVGHDIGVSQAGGVVGHEELELAGGGVGVELLKPGFHLDGVVLRAAVVDGEGVDAGLLREGDVDEVAAVGGLRHDHVVGEDEGVAVVARAGVKLVVGVVGVVLVSEG